MTQDEIIHMAREAGLICESRPVTAWIESTDLTPYLTRFAALVAAHEREKQVEREPVGYYVTAGRRVSDGMQVVFSNDEILYAAPVSIESAVLAEREACAKLVETTHAEKLQSIREACAATIRSRSNEH